MYLRAAVSVIFASLVCGQSYIISTFVGGVPPDKVLGTSAGLGSVQGVAADAAGNVFILSGFVVFRLDATTRTLTRIAGNGAPGFSGDGGPATDAKIDGFFNGKNGNGLAVDPAGNSLYIAGPGHVRKISNGVITTLVGVGASGIIGGIAADSAGNLYVADNLSGLVSKVSNGVTSTVAGGGTSGVGDNGPATSAQIDPTGVAVDSGGNLYISDGGGNRIRKVANGVITTVAGNGTYGFTGDGGPATSAELRAPYNVAVDSTGNVYIADEGLRIRKISNGTITTVAGSGTYGFSGDNGPAISAELGIPNGVAADSAGNVYIADHSNERIRKVSNGVINTVAGSSGDNYSATSVQLNAPSGVAMDSTGNLFISEFGTNRIRKVSIGVVTTVAGDGTLGFSGDNGPATSAQLSGPQGVAVDSAGNLYIADTSNYVIRKVSNGVITTVAGNGTFGFSGDNGPATSAQLGSPGSVAVDAAGNLYIADTGNNRIRKVSNGVITTVAGNGTFGFSGDNGPATSAQLGNPQGVAVDSAGKLYIADSGNQRIRMVSNGVVTTVAGNGTPGFAGDSGPATSAQITPGGVAVDSVGNLYIADTGNQRIREVSNEVITTLAGNGTVGFSGDNGPALSASLSSPTGIALDSSGSVYFSDPNSDNRVRVLTPPFTNKNSASYAPAALAPDMIAFAGAANIAPELMVAPDGPWPLSLEGVSLEITDSSGQKLQAPIYYVTTNVIAYLIPAGTAPGHATLKLTTSTGAIISGTLEIARTSPALYTANASGSGVPAGFWIRVVAGGAQSQDYLFDPSQPVGSRVPVPVDLGAAGDQVFLSLYGTGFRGASNPSATVDGVNVPVYGFAATGAYQGEDVVNVGPLPRSLAGLGVVNVVVTFDNKSANTVTVSIR